MRASGVPAPSPTRRPPSGVGDPGWRRPFERRDWTFAGLALLMLLLALLGVVQAWDPYLGWTSTGERLAGVSVSVVGVAALACAPRWPALSLVLVWVALLGVVVIGVPPQVALLMTVLVGFACSAWGGRTTLWLSGLSIPVASAVVVLAVDPSVVSGVLARWGGLDYAYELYQVVNWRVLVFVLPQVALWLPWLGGLALRFRDRSVVAVQETAVAEAERDQAEEVAQVREQQAQLARDVHDVVGHSLTVILAQAQAAQFLRDEEQVRAALETIATTAQSSLADVRRVLSATSDGPVEAPATEELHAMLDAVRASGRQVEFTEEGQSRPLPPELATVAHRVLQEMLTNAVRHGVDSEPIHVERHWGWDLRLEVANAITPPAPVEETQPLVLADATLVRRVGADGPGPLPPRQGHGVVGMRRRLESVGGRLDLRVRQNPPTHTVTAWIPLPGTLGAEPKETSRG